MHAEAARRQRPARHAYASRLFQDPNQSAYDDLIEWNEIKLCLSFHFCPPVHANNCASFKTRGIGMRKILVSLIAALMTTTAMAQGGPPKVTIEYDLGLFAIPMDVDARDAGQLMAQCQSNGEVELFGLTVPCADVAISANRGGARVITFYIGLLF